VRSYSVIPLRFGRAAEERLSDSPLAHYAAIAKWLLGESKLTDKGPLTSVPIGIEAMVNAKLVSQLLRPHRPPNAVSLVIIDMAMSAKPMLPTHHVVAGLIGTILEPMAANAEQKAIILLPLMLPDTDIVVEALDPYIKRGMLTLVARDGTNRGLDKFGISDTKCFVKSAKAAIPHPLDLLRHKIIRFPGHFKRFSGDRHSHCNEYYFDASLCQVELTNLIDDYMQNLDVNINELEVFYHATISEWLEQSMLALNERRDINACNMENITTLSKSNKSSILLVLPLIDTGDTIANLLAILRKQRKNFQIKVVSILSTDGDGDDFGKRKENGETIDYFLKVHQPRHKKGTCPMCELNIPSSDPMDPDPYLKLTASAFWAISKDVGVGEEQDVPGYRESIGYLPQFNQLDHRNSAYLAYKIEKLLSKNRKLTAEPIILCPEEDGARALGNALEIVFNMTVIRVPKKFLDVDGSNVTVESLLRRGKHVGDLPPWAISLQSLQRQQEQLSKLPLVFDKPSRELVIFDELSVTGKTHKMMGNFVTSLGFSVGTYFSVLDLHQNDEAGFGPALSLYDLPMGP
jgi:hypothetical protein